jgi:hypothetical protein
MGYGIVIFESIYAAHGLNRPMETALLSRLSAVIPWILGTFLIVRFGDLIVRGALGTLFSLKLNSLLFIVENALFLYAFLALAFPEKRTKPRTLFLAATAVLLAGSLYRFNVYLVALSPAPGWHYFPSISEIMAYLYIVKKFPVLPKAEHA